MGLYAPLRKLIGHVNYTPGNEVYMVVQTDRPTDSELKEVWLHEYVHVYRYDSFVLNSHGQLNCVCPHAYSKVKVYAETDEALDYAKKQLTVIMGRKV